MVKELFFLQVFVAKHFRKILQEGLLWVGSVQQYIAELSRVGTIELVRSFCVIIQATDIFEEWLCDANETCTLNLHVTFFMEELTILIEEVHFNTCYIICFQNKVARVFLKEFKHLFVDVKDKLPVLVQGELLLLDIEEYRNPKIKYTLF